VLGWSALVSRSARERADLNEYPRSQREQRQLLFAQQREDEERAQLERAARFNLALCLEDAGDRDEAFLDDVTSVLLVPDEAAGH